jgi:ATP-dependent Clp protease, protease subunit
VSTRKDFSMAHEVMHSPGDEMSGLLEMLPAQQLFRKRRIILAESIHAGSAKKVMEQMLALDSSEPGKDIYLFLNSPGGEVNSGFGIYDVMRFVESPVKVIVTGLAASIATVILLGAKKEHRFSLPNSRLLIHQPLIGGNVQGQASDIEITAREILKTRERIVELYHKETGQSMERLQRDVERDYWMTAIEAKEYGLITKIISSTSEVMK